MQIFEKYQMRQITNTDEIRRLCEIVIGDNPKLVRRYKNGKESELQKLVHKTFDLSNKKACVPLVIVCLKNLLKS